MTFHNTQGDALGYVLDGLSGYSTHVFHELPKLELVKDVCEFGVVINYSEQML
ncbi:MAG: hypothetical protein IKO85_10550 [Bacteroidaceae bacterium]|nr:hypothetical protein [Bacteroidaceae bacterium]